MKQALSLNCGGKLLCLSQPRIMGILNLSPDSFYDGGKRVQQLQHLQHAELLLQQGADLIDLGAMSSRPSAVPVSEREEMARLLPPLKAIVKQFPHALISIDTYRKNVAAAAIAEGARLINDISGGNFDPQLAVYLIGKSIPYIIMHLQGTPQTMQQNPHYTDVAQEVFTFLQQRARQYQQSGIKDIVIDPGFGFGKTVAHNYQLLQQLEQLQVSGLPILVGLSRKSMIYKVLNNSPEQALNGTSVLHTIALLKGAHILRVHDVVAAKETITLLQCLGESS